VFEEGGIKGIACYLYSLVPNQTFLSDAKSSPKIGPLKSTMFATKSGTFKLLYDNARDCSWFGINNGVFPVWPKSEPSEGNIWEMRFSATRNLSDFNYWVWEKMEGFEERWPPFIPIKTLVRAKKGGHLAVSPKEESEIQHELNEVMKRTWPKYLDEHWKGHPIYSNPKVFAPVIQAQELLDVIKEAFFDGRRHKGCKPGLVQAEGVCCGLPLLDRLMGWNPMETDVKKIVWEPITGPILLLPKREHAMAFYETMFPQVSDIPTVWFPHHWQPDRFDALVDALGSPGEIRLLDNPDDEGVYSTIGRDRDRDEHSPAIGDVQ
jgi:hypothetical protein